MVLLSAFASILLLIAFFSWGVYSLRRRYWYHDELPLSIEALTLILVLIFYAFEISSARYWLGDAPVRLMFAVLGLVVAGAALYGPMVTSMASRLIVDSLLPPERDDPTEPRYGPAEGLEHQGDFEGAVREYMVIARIFPNKPTAPVRIGHLLMRLDRPAEAAEWFERGVRLMDSAEKCLPIVNRLVEVYSGKMQRPAAAAAALDGYLARFPESPYAESVRQRLARLQEKQAGEAGDDSSAGAPVLS